MYFFTLYSTQPLFLSFLFFLSQDSLSIFSLFSFVPTPLFPIFLSLFKFFTLSPPFFTYTLSFFLFFSSIYLWFSIIPAFCFPPRWWVLISVQRKRFWQAARYQSICTKNENYILQNGGREEKKELAGIKSISLTTTTTAAAAAPPPTTTKTSKNHKTRQIKNCKKILKNEKSNNLKTQQINK